MKDIPVYRFPAEHARENGELELYRASNKASAACKEAIGRSPSIIAIMSCTGKPLRR